MRALQKILFPTLLFAANALGSPGVSCIDVFSESHFKHVVENFLFEHKAKRTTVNDSDLTIRDFFPHRNTSQLDLSAFNSLGDTWEHSQLIYSALSQKESSSISKVMDFFSGSSLPTLRLMAMDSRLASISFTAVDIDGDAIEVSRANAKNLGFDGNFTFIKGDAVGVLYASSIDQDTLVALNPPYVPFNPALKDPKFSAIDGGPLGTKFIIPFLNYPYKSGTIVALTFSSLSDPARVIKLIRAEFEVLQVQAYETEFGIYTSSPQVLPWLIQQKANQRAHFSEHVDGKRSYTIIGIVLRKR